MLNDSSIGMVPYTLLGQSITSVNQDDTMHSDQNQQSIIAQQAGPKGQLPKTRILKLKKRKKKVFRNAVTR